MKRLIRGLIPTIMGLVFGSVSGLIIYKIYIGRINEELSSSKMYLVENGKYETYDEMRSSNISDSYMYYVDDEMYTSVVGITKSLDNANKIKNLFPTATIRDDYYVSKEMINGNQEVMEDKLKNTKNDEETKEVMKEILSMYKDEETMRLVLVK